MLVVAHQAPVEGQDAERLLDNPALRLGHEPLVGRVALDDLHVNARGGAVGDDRALEPLINQGRATVGVLALIVLSYDRTGSPFLAAVAYRAGTVPYLFVGLFLVGLGDRLP